MPKAVKKRAPGEFAPTQFATCLESALNIHAQTTDAAAPSKSDKKKKQKQEASKSKGKKHNFVDNPAVKGSAVSVIKSNPRIECTNGAMEALHLCHSEFIKATSIALVALESSSNHNNPTIEQGAAASKKKVSFSSTTKTVTYNENHVVEIMKQMGFSNLVERAMESLNAGSSKQQHTNNNKVKPQKTQQQQQQQQQPSKQPPQNKKRKRKSNPLDDAALLAEQERLLSESARRVYHNHNQQQKEQLQLQKKDGKIQVKNTSSDLGSSSSVDRSGELV
jgi:hypothetical protein